MKAFILILTSFFSLNLYAWDLDDCAAAASSMGCGLGAASYGPMSMNIELIDGLTGMVVGACSIIFGSKVPNPPLPPLRRLPRRECGSIIRVDSQALGESVPLVGTDDFLSYTTNRSASRAADYTLNLPITDTPYDSDLSSITVEVDIAGQTHSYPYSTLSDGMVFSFTWDGKDASSNWVKGSATASVDVHKYYSIPGVPDIPRRHEFVLGHYKADPFGGLGGWTISSHHFYDPLRKMTYLGDGETLDGLAQKVDMGSGGELQVVATPTFDYYLIASKDNKEAYLFDANGFHIQTRSILTGALLESFAYDGSNMLTSITDAFGKTTTITRPSSTLIEIEAPYGQITAITLDGSGRAITITDPMSRDYEITYDTAGLIATFEKPSGAVNTFTYDSAGFLSTDNHSAGAALDFVHSLTFPTNSIKSTIDMTTAEGRDTRFEVTSSSTSMTRTETLPGGNTRIFFYYPGSSLRTTDERGRYTEWGLAADPRFGTQEPRRSSWYVSSGSQSASASISLSETFPGTDILNLTTSSENEVIAGKTWNRSFNGTTNIATHTSPEGRVRTKEYNAENQVIETQDYGFDPVEYAYDLDGRLHTLTQSARVTTINYNAEGWVSSVENAESETTSFTYNDNGQVLTQTLPDSRVLQYTYDSNGNVASLETATNNTHSFLSNLYDLMQSYIAPILNMTNYVTSYDYNDDKQLTLVTKPDSSTIAFIYGAANGRLNKVTTPEGDYNRSYDSKDQTTQLTSPQSVTNNFTYDGDLVATATTTTANFTAKASYARSAHWPTSSSVIDDSNVTSSVSYTYDDDRLLESAGTMSITRSSTSGFVTKNELGNVEEFYTYNSTYGELATYQIKYSGSEIYKEEYTRDLLGRITQKIVTLNGSTSTTYDYVHDSSGRLHETYVNSTLTRTYNYDDNSNRTSVVAGSTTSGTYDDQDRILTYGANTYTHTTNGYLSQVTDGTNTTNFEYDSLGGLVEAEVITGLGTDTYTYLNDALGRRIERKKNGTLEKRYLYDDANRLIAELDSSGDLISHFVYATRSHSPDYMIKGTDKFMFVRDQLGSVVQVVNVSTGVVASSMTYDEFGVLTGSTVPEFQPFGFAGGLYDAPTGLIRFGARDYDPVTARWTAKDPILFNGGDTNLYGYVINDPVNFIDPTGLVFDPRGGGGGGFIPPGGSGVGAIRGYTNHGLDRSIGGGTGDAAGRSVNPRSILDTVRNPISTQPNPGGGTRYNGTTSTVIINSQGRIITTWPEGGGGLRCPIPGR